MTPEDNDRIEGLLDAGLDPAGQDLRACLALVLAAWPSDDAAGLRQRRMWNGLLRRLIQPDTEGAQGSRGAELAAALQLIEPDRSRRMRALRYVMARISHATPAADAALRQRTGGLIAAMLQREDARGEEDIRRKASQTDMLAAAELLVTESAGLILLHPFLKLLFERLGILGSDIRLERTGLPMALAALRALDGRPAQGGLDPLQRLLLGIPDAAPPPEGAALDAAGQDLIDGLLRSVITHWGRLGKTSPDGLRETFLQRTGTLRFDETGAHLRVTPGPFDMLLDGLPWSLGTVALPWMARPCHVRWRDRDE